MAGDDGAEEGGVEAVVGEGVVLGGAAGEEVCCC